MLKTLRFIWNHPLAKLNRREAISRFIRWQLASRLINCPIILPFVNNSVIVTEVSMTGATGNFYCGLDEFADMAFVLHFLRQGDLFLDLGANVGSYTILASGVVGARTICCEPVPSTFTRLMRNIKINEIEDITKPLQVVVGCDDKEVRFSIDRDTVNSVVEESYEGLTVSVPSSSLDKLLQFESPSLWKVDVEGYELAVLNNARCALLNPELKAVLLEGQSEMISDIMVKCGFAKALYDPMSRSLVVEKGTFLSNGQNQLWVRDVDFVIHRCGSSEKYKINGISF